MKRLFVLNGGAAVKPGNRGAFLRFDNPAAAFAKGGINTGDVLVYDAMLKALAYDQIANLQFSHAADTKLWPEPGYAATVVRGSNYLAESVDLAPVVPLLKQLKGPIVGMGIGAQAATYRKLDLPKGTVEAWRIIADKCESIGVRGFYSAEVFNDIGIKNVRAIGCPSFYRSLRPSVALRKLDPAGARVGLTLNKYLSAEYASNAIKTNRMQRALILAVAKREAGRLYSQGEREETLAIFASETEKTPHVEAILKRFALAGEKPAEDLLRRRMAAFFDVDEWAEDVGRNVDAMVGFRLHGNVIALHQGIPAVFFTYDTRIREIAALFALPAVEVEDYLPVDLARILEAADFAKFQHVYRLNYAEYHRFLTENGLSHVLPKPVATPTGKPLSALNLVELHPGVEALRAWMRQEVDFMTGEMGVLRDRAWHLETTLRDLRRRAAERPSAVAV